MKRVYLDHNATTPLRPQAQEVLIEHLRKLNGNPSSLHLSGRAARAVIDEARACVAGALGVSEDSVTFTGGGTEANNLALLGAMRAAQPGASLALLTTEHASVLEPARQLQREGYPLRWCSVDGNGLTNAAALAEQACGAHLVSVAAANNETGALGPLPGLRTALDEASATQDFPRTAIHTDASQALGRIDLPLTSWGVDLATLSAHKVGGPAGVGVLLHLSGPQATLPLTPILHGGGQENGLRPGTEHPAAIAAAACAIDLAIKERKEVASRWREQINTLWSQLKRALPEVRFIGPGPGSNSQLPNTLAVHVPGTDGRVIVTRLDLEGLEVSAGSACSSGSLEPSHVLQAMGLGNDVARSCLRLSLGRETSEAELCRAVEIMSKTFAASPKSS